MTPLQFYRAQAAEQKAEAEAAVLQNVRERCQRASDAWAALAAKSEHVANERVAAQMPRVPQVVVWAEGLLAPIMGDSLHDPRVSIEIRDVHDVIVRRHACFDAILLDVDNGPDGLINLANERLDCNRGLRAARAALRPGGILAIWSAYPDPALSGRLRSAGFETEIHNVHGGGGDDAQAHTIWLAARPG